MKVFLLGDYLVSIFLHSDWIRIQSEWVKIRTFFMQWVLHFNAYNCGKILEKLGTNWVNTKQWVSHLQKPENWVNWKNICKRIFNANKDRNKKNKQLIKIDIADAYSAPLFKTFKVEYFEELVNENYFCKPLHLGCVTGLWIYLRIALLKHDFRENE